MKFFHVMDGPPLFTNGFLMVGNQGHAVAVDPAAPAAQFEALLAENNATLTHILLTHGHYDHIGSVEALRSATGALLCMNKADEKLAGLAPDVEFVDGGTFSVDDMTFKTIFTPGHTPGSVCIVCGDAIFTGDTLFAGDIGRTDLPGGNMDDMKRSLVKLANAVTEDLQVLPGHEEFSTMATEKAQNPYLQF